MESHFNIVAILKSSSPIVQFVLLLLVLASVVSWTIIIKKMREMRKIKQNNKEFMNVFLSQQSMGEVFDKAKSKDLLNSPYATLFCSGFEEYLKLKKRVDDFTTSPGVARYGLESIQRALRKGANETLAVMDSFLTPLATIGTISPFVGLLGTVWGIINSFSGLATGSGGLEMVAPGIAEALVATAIGLFAAIPAHLFYNYYSGQNAQLGLKLESFEQDFLNLVARNFLAAKK